MYVRGSSAPGGRAITAQASSTAPGSRPRPGASGPPEGGAAQAGSRRMVKEVAAPVQPQGQGQGVRHGATLSVPVASAGEDVWMSDDVLADQVDYYRLRAGEYDVTAYGDVAAASEHIAGLVARLR